MSLGKNEIELLGGWNLVDGHMEEDGVARRIQSLIGSELKKIATDSTGWYVLYQDPADGRLWEKFFPQGGMHGGGPPALRVTSLEQAREKYKMP